MESKYKKKIFVIHIQTKNLYSEYVKHHYNSRITNSPTKIDKGVNTKFTKNKYMNG